MKNDRGDIWGKREGQIDEWGVTKKKRASGNRYKG